MNNQVQESFEKKKLSIRCDQEVYDRFAAMVGNSGKSQAEFLADLMNRYEHSGRDYLTEKIDHCVSSDQSKSDPDLKYNGLVESLTDRQIMVRIYQAFLNEPLKQHLDGHIDEIVRITQTSLKAEEVLNRISEAKRNVVEIAERSEKAYTDIQTSVKKDVSDIKQKYEDLVISTSEKCKESIKESTRKHIDSNQRINGHFSVLEKSVIKTTSVADDFEKMCREQTRNIAEASLNHNAKLKEISDGIIKRINWTITLNKVLCATAVVALLAGLGNIYYTVSEGVKAQEAKASYSSCVAYVQGVQNQACIMNNSDSQIRSLKEKLNCPSS